MRKLMFLFWFSLAACSSAVDTSDTSSSGGNGGGGGGTPGAIGDMCASNADCASGLCVDMSKVESTCSGKICSQTCTSNDECPLDFAQPDCDTTPLGSICLYGAWSTLYCGK